jgi:MGC83106 protein
LSINIFLFQIDIYLIYIFIKRKDGRFYPTKLVTSLTSNTLAKPEIREEGYIIVETNYRVYAYTSEFFILLLSLSHKKIYLPHFFTDSPLQIALLALFTEMQYRLPNLCLGVLTRDSVRQALKSGITAEQIIHFLKSNAHPRMTSIPPTIVVQIRLWEIERDRFLFKEGVLYSQFLSQSDFQLLRTYANVSIHYYNYSMIAFILNL